MYTEMVKQIIDPIMFASLIGVAISIFSFLILLAILWVTRGDIKMVGFIKFSNPIGFLASSDDSLPEITMIGLIGSLLWLIVGYFSTFLIAAAILWPWVIVAVALTIGLLFTARLAYDRNRK